MFYNICNHRYFYIIILYYRKLTNTLYENISTVLTETDFSHSIAHFIYRIVMSTFSSEAGTVHELDVQLAISAFRCPCPIKIKRSHFVNYIMFQLEIMQTSGCTIIPSEISAANIVRFVKKTIFLLIIS